MTRTVVLLQQVVITFLVLVQHHIVLVQAKSSIVKQSSSNQHHLRKQQQQHPNNNVQQRKTQETSCNAGEYITGFSVYNATSNTTTDLRFNEYFIWTYPKASLFLEQYPEGKLNIIVNTLSCPNKPPIQCVKISLGDYQTTYEKTLPYTLYGDNVGTGIINVAKPTKTGWQPLQAWTYSTSDCTGDATSTKHVDVHIVPKTIVTVAVGPIITFYQGTSTASNATPAQTTATVKATCDYINQGLDYGFLYKSNCWLTKLKCWRVVSSNTTSTAPAPPLSITYKLSATFQMGLDINPYINRDLPKRPEVTEYVKRLFNDSVSIGPFSDQLMSSFVKSKIDTLNPYYPYTSITFG